MVTQLRLRPIQGVRGSDDDLRTFFYALENAPDAVVRNAFGRLFDGRGVEAW